MKYLTASPDILDGTLCIRGTRLPIDEVLYLLQEGNSLAQINALYPWVPKDILRGAVAEAFSEVMNLLTTKHHAS